MSRLLKFPGFRHYVKYRTEYDFFDRLILRCFWGFCAGSLYSIKDIPEIKREIDFNRHSNIEKTFLTTVTIPAFGFCYGVAGAILFSVPLISVPVYCAIKFEDMKHKKNRFN